MKGGATNTISVNKVKICCWVEREDTALFSNHEHKQHKIQAPFPAKNV